MSAQTFKKPPHHRCLVIYEGGGPGSRVCYPCTPRCQNLITRMIPYCHIQCNSFQLFHICTTNLFWSKDKWFHRVGGCKVLCILPAKVSSHIHCLLNNVQKQDTIHIKSCSFCWNCFKYLSLRSMVPKRCFRTNWLCLSKKKVRPPKTNSSYVKMLAFSQ